MTHIQNIPHILIHGITGKESPNANPDYVPIGDASLIGTRSSVYIPGTAYTVGEFIPFYFWIRMPMLFRIQSGHDVKKVSPQNIVYLVCDIDSILSAGYSFFFTNGHAVDSFSTFYTKSQISLLPQVINEKAVKASYWGGEDNIIIRWQKQAEFLILNDIDPKYICRILCYNEDAKKALLSMGVADSLIKNYPQAYY
jgi:hypothetical protein